MVAKSLLKSAACQYGIRAKALNFISDSTNEIYRFPKNGTNYIMRFSRRPPSALAAIEAEMDWLAYLSRAGMHVSLPLAAANGTLAVAIENKNEHWVISAFEMAGGRFWDKNNPALWNRRIFHNWGKTTGELHAITKQYNPPNPIAREHFQNPYIWSENIQTCPALHQKACEITDEINALPRGADAYGLIHCDIHPWNFHIDGDAVRLFDFDDTIFGWHALDIGIALYHALWWGRGNDAGYDFTHEIIGSFLEGYLLANKLDPFWIKKIPLFMRFRQVCKFSWFYDPAQKDAHAKERIDNILQGRLFTGHTLPMELFDFGSLRQ